MTFLDTSSTSTVQYLFMRFVCRGRAGLLFALTRSHTSFHSHQHQQPLSAYFSSIVSKMATPPRKYFCDKSLSTCADLFIVPMFSDNYCFIITDRVSGKTAVVDPGEPSSALRGLEEIQSEAGGMTPSLVLCTHKHGDHAGGNTAFTSRFPELQVMGPRYEEVDGVTWKVGEGEEIPFGSLKIRVLYTPCHTSGHIVYVVTGESGSPILFSGDTLFVGGCGRFFEGTAKQMLDNMDRLSLLPEDTLVCCAHEFSESNYRFLSSVDTERCESTLFTVRALRAQGRYTVPSTIGEEKQSNLFMRCRDRDTQRRMDVTDVVDDEDAAVETMKRLRERKNNFR